jgi:LacI family transcriptional regulator
MKSTIRDVARAAGVSIGTVSRVLNGNSAVSEESRSRVDSVVRSLNYYPLRKRRAANSGGRLMGKRIAIVLLGMDRSLSTAPLLAEMIHGVEAVLAEGGGHVELINLPNLDEPPAALKQDDLNGLLLFGALQGNMVKAAKASLIRRLSSLPSVWFIRRPEHCWGDSVGPNDWQIGRMAADYLLSNGHRRLAFLSPRSDQASWRLRKSSFVERAEESGAEVKCFLGSDENGASFPIRSFHNPDTIDKLVGALVKESPRPTALFIPTDSAAPFVYRALASHNIEIGKDLSVISCNNERPYTEALHPSLTTLDIHAELLGRLAVRQLALRMRGGELAKPSVEIAMEPTLLPAESVCPLS